MLARHGAKDAVSQGALVAMAPDGAVRAMVGGRDYGESQFNRATQAQRQPGSAFKPFVYLAGLEAGLRPDDHFVDAPIRIGNWQPHNYTGRYQGEMTLAEGAGAVDQHGRGAGGAARRHPAMSSRSPTGSASPRELAPDASIALGTNEVNLLELVSAYAPFANGGTGVLPYGIAEIRDSAGKVVYRRTGSGPGQVVAPELVGADERDAGAASSTTAPARRPRCRARPPARPARPRITATPGSSATPPTSSPACGSATTTTRR